MSRHHPSRLHAPRPASWAWSGVVLFSTLLLSPVASASLLSALARALPQWAAPAASAPAQTPPRRASEEETAARVLLHSVLEEREAEADQTVTPQDTVRPQANAARRVFAFPPGGFYIARPAFPPAPADRTPRSACAGLRVPRAPPLV